LLFSTEHLAGVPLTQALGQRQSIWHSACEQSTFGEFVNVRRYDTNLTVQLLALVMALGGCSKHEPESPPEVMQTPGPVLPPDAKRNPSSVDSIPITFTVETSEQVNVAGMTARASYVISNAGECVPVDYSKALGGRRNRTIKLIDLPITTVETGSFRVNAPTRPFLDEDYYALGTCRWALSIVTFVLGSQSASITGSEIEDGRSKSALCFLSPPSTTVCRNSDSVDPKYRSLFFPVTIRAIDD
jgi:hypothetical protein